MQHKEYRLAAIMFTDIQGFSRMMERDERATLELLDWQNDLITKLAANYQGRVIKTIGDALLVVFNTTLDAVNCGLDIQNKLAEMNRTSGKDPLLLRIGIHLGDIYFFDDDALGEGINIASRLQALAYPGCICISQDVYNNVVNKIHADFRKLGRVNLKNITKEINAYEIVTASAVDYSRTTEEEPDRRPPPVVPRPTPALGDAPTPVPTSALWRRTEPDSPGPSKGTPEEFDELKTFVVQQIKRVGRRISVERLQSMFPHHGSAFNEAVDKLADMGFLTRERPASDRPAGGAENAEASAAKSDEMSGPWDWSKGWGQQGIDREAWRAARHEWRRAWRQERHSGNWDENTPLPPGVPGIPGGPEFLDLGSHATYAEYRARLIDRSYKVKGGFVAHLVSFLGVNGFLFFLNITVGGHFPWFLFPFGGWAIGLLSHLATVVNRQNEKADVEALPEKLDDKDYELLRKYHRARAGARSSAVSLASVGGFLLMVNLITSASYLWALFPIGGLAIAFVSSVTPYLFRRGSFLKRLNFLKKNKSSIEVEGGETAATEADPAIVRQAIELSDAILLQAKGLDKSKAYIAEDLKPLLENYVGQIRKLTRKSSEVERIMAAIPHAELGKDLVELRRRSETAASASLKTEYQRSIEQIERQNKSFEELTDQKELMDLRISNSLNSLKQMQLDLARMSGMASTSEPNSLDSFKRKSQELTQYLDDLGSGYEEIERMPQMGEQERSAADRLLAEFKKKEQSGDKGTA